MQNKQTFIKFMAVFVLNFSLLPVSAFATGEELPDQDQTIEDTDNSNNDSMDSSANNSSIGGGTNVDNEENRPLVPNKPEPSEDSVVSKPLPQPEDQMPEQSTPTTSSSPTTSQSTPPAVIVKPQSQKPSSNFTPAPETSTAESTNAAEGPLTVIPTAPNVNIAPTGIETPRTGIVDNKATPINLLAVILLILAGVTVIAAGIISTILSKAGQHNQPAI